RRGGAGAPWGGGMVVRGPGKATLAMVRGQGAAGGLGAAAAKTPGKQTNAMAAEAGMKGKPLEDSTQRRMGGLFGTSFADVKVFDGSSEASGSTRALAKDRELHFREGAYQPNTDHGDKVIAHELAHLVQLGG